MTGLLDKLPAVWRHLIIIAGSTFVGGLVSAVLASKGVTGVDWLPVLRDDLDATAVATVTGVSVLWLVPLNAQYGLGSDKAA